MNPGKMKFMLVNWGDGHGRWQISNDGGYSAVWRSDNKEIFYFQRSDLMSVDVNMADGKFEIGQPQKLFTKPLNFSGVVSASRYCASKDGQRFLMNVPIQKQTNDNIIIVQNWLEELEQK